MKVILKDSIYEMDRKQFHGVLEIAKKSVPKAIYAVEKQGIAEMKNETYENKEELRKAVSEYAKTDLRCTTMRNECHMASCRYNRNGICQNEDKRKECVDVSMSVLCLEDFDENNNEV